MQMMHRLLVWEDEENSKKRNKKIYFHFIHTKQWQHVHRREGIDEKGNRQTNKYKNNIRQTRQKYGQAIQRTNNFFNIKVQNSIYTVLDKIWFKSFIVELQE